MGDFKELGAVAIGIVIAVVVIAMGAKVLSSINDDLTYSVERTVTVYDTNRNLNSSTTINLSKFNVTSGSLTVRNVTGNVLVPSTNYTLVLPSATLKATVQNWTLVNVTYTYDVYDTTAKDSIRNGTKGLGTLGKWTPTIALIAIAGIILTLVLGGLYFAFKD